MNDNTLKRQKWISCLTSVFARECRNNQSSSKESSENRIGCQRPDFFYEVVILWHARSGGCLDWLSRSHDRGEQVSWERGREEGGGDVEGPSFVISRLVILHSWVTCAQQRGEKVPFPPDIHPQHFFPEDDEWLPGTIYKPLSKAWGWYPESESTQTHLTIQTWKINNDTVFPGDILPYTFVLLQRALRMYRQHPWGCSC